VRYFIAVMWFIFLSVKSDGQSFPALNFRSITEADGLSNNTVNAITQDVRGVMWIATANGLNRYDGTRIKKIFAHPKDSNALQGNFLPYIDKDNSGNIFISYNTGINLMNCFTDSFTDNKIGASCLLKYRNKNYVFSESGVYELKNGKASLDPIWNRVDKLRKQKNESQYNNLVVDKEGNLWGCSFNRIDKIDTETKRVLETYGIPNFSFFRNIFVDSNNEFWISTWGSGVIKFDKQTKAFEKINKKQGGSIILSLNEWVFNGSRFIIAASDNGIILINPKTLEKKLYDKLSDGNKPITQCNHLYIDKDNNLWLSTKEGVKIVTSFSSAFEVIPIISKEQKEIASVYQCRELPSGYWISKRYNGGIFHYDKNWKLIHYWKNLLPSVNTKYPDSPTNEAYEFIQKGNEVYITIEAGIAKMNLQTNQISLFQTADSIAPRLRNMVQLTDTSWMIRSVFSGIYLFNPQKNTFYKRYKIFEKNTNKITQLYHIAKSNSNAIIVSNAQGLYLYNSVADEFQPLCITDATTKSFFGMAFDNKGILWAASANGVVAIDIKEKRIIKEFENYNQIGSVNRLTVDNDDKVWFNCEMGYWCFNQQTQQMLQFNYGSGLPKQGEEAGFFTLNDGNAYGGTINGIVKFNNEYLKNYTTKSKISISEILVNGITNNAMKMSNDSLQTLRLKSDEKNLDIYFSVPDYAQQGNYTYYYRIGSGKNDWEKIENGFIKLNNLMHGNYRLQLKAQNNITGSFTPINELRFSIAAKWFQTWLFKILVFFTVGFLLYSFFKYRANQIRKNEKLKTEFENRMLHLEMQNLRSQMNPHFIFNSLNSINSFIVENKTHLASDYLTKFSRLIRLILENSKNEVIPLEKEIETLKLYLLMESVRFSKKFDYEVIVADDLDEQMIKIPPMIIQPYVENAIWHGLLHKEEKGKVVVAINKIAEKIQITIEDNGIGRDKAGELKSKNSTTNKSYGLQITAQRIKQLNVANTIDIIDLKDNKQHALGTKVNITINFLSLQNNYDESTNS
jgi:ligand-binding sensor domain-containing protein